MTLLDRKEKFLIDYILARAAFKDRFDPLLSLQDAEAVWNKIQKLKYA